MENAWEELSDILVRKHKGVNEIVHAYITGNPFYVELEPTKVYFDMRVDSLISMPDKLNFTYDDCYGGQELFGLIVFIDGSWLERGGYDGSEWWEYKKTPTIDEVYGSGA